MDTELACHWWAARGTDRDLDVNALWRLTRDYWRQSGTLEQRMRWYVEDLLPEELKYAEARKALEFRPCDTLALLVGYSLEPLFQVISVFQPQRLVLLLNQWYGSQDDPQRQRGKSRGQDVRELIRDFLSPLLCRLPTTIDLYEVADQPDAVFRALCQHVLPDQQKGKDVIVDITGAKKSMDAGAFLFAAYADIPISYVDFDDYDEDKRRPLGFTCRIGALANPYNVFRLRDWERVRRLYDSYHFRAAAETLAGILRIMQEPMFEPKHIEAANRLLAVLEFYGTWDDGDYWKARQRLPGLRNCLPSFSPPAAILWLGDVWPHADGPSTEAIARKLLAMNDALVESIFEDNRLLLAYAYDELAKIDRLVEANEETRSALLRAAGLDEFLLKARLMRLWKRNLLRVELRFDLNGGRSHLPRRLPQDFEACLRQVLCQYNGAEYMRLVLVRDPGSYLQLRYVVTEGRQYAPRLKEGQRGDKSFVIVKYPRAANQPTLSPYWDHTGVDMESETLNLLRDHAIHLSLHVTRPLARSAVALVRANLNDFERSWTSLSGRIPRIELQDVQTVPWEQMCNLCGLDLLPLMP
jgi:hypothetical protein